MCIRDRIHVVAAEHHVVADTDSGQFRVAVATRGLNQGQIGRGAPDIANHPQLGISQFIRKAVLMAIPVSYTHLDVYKRQDHLQSVA